MNSLAKQLNRPIHCRARVLRAGGIFAKDVLRYLPLMLAVIGVLGVGMLLVGVSRQFLSVGLNQFLTTIAYTAGFVVCLEERETGTWEFLGSLPVSRWKILFQKLAAAAVLAVVSIPVTGITMEFVPGLTGELFNVVSWTTRLEPETPYLMLGALLTGVAVGLVMPPNLVAGLLLGPALFYGYLASFQWGVVNRVLPTTFILHPTPYAMAFWSVLMAGVIVFRVARPEWRLVALDWNGVPRLVARSRAGFRRPVLHQLRWVFPVAVAFAAGAIFVVNRVGGSPGSEFLLLTIILGLLLGVSAIAAGERVAHEFQYYHLPVARSQFFRERVWALGWRAVVLGVIGAAGAPFVANNDLVYPGSAICFLLPVCGAFLAFAFALFVRLRLVAVILAVAVLLPWVFASGACTVALAGFPLFGRAELPAYVAWAVLCTVGLPTLVSWLGICRAPLLEQPEGRRAWMAIAVLLVLGAWGTLALLVSPRHLLIMIFG
jgi:hypothetical protein